MTDYFALLDQPRKPWLDPEALKVAFHAKSLQAHPDAQSQQSRVSDDDGSAFAELNQAHQVLQDPKQRLLHLLKLEDRAPTSRQSSVPPEIEQLFSVVAGVTNESDALLRKLQSATNRVSRSLLRPQTLEVQHRMAEALRQLSRLHDSGVEELRRLSAVSVLEEDAWTDMYRLYLRFSYVTRWMEELREKQMRLASA